MDHRSTVPEYVLEHEEILEIFLSVELSSS